MSRSQSSYAKELLNHSLEVLSAIDVGIPEASIASSSPSDRVATAAKDFASTKPITRAKLADILNKLDQGKTGGQRPQSPTQNVTDLLLEADLMARAVTMAWRETMDVLMNNAQRMSTELNWWQSIAHSRRFVGLYFLQTLPLRLYQNLPRTSSLKDLRTSALSWPKTTSLFQGSLLYGGKNKLSMQNMRSVMLPISNPVTLTRREVLSTIKDLRAARDRAAELIGFMATQAPKWEKIANVLTEQTVDQLSNETTRIYALLCVILELPLPMPSQPSSVPSTPTRRVKATLATVSQPLKMNGASRPSAATLYTLVDSEIPKLEARLLPSLEAYTRPGFLTRYWIAALVLPPLALYLQTAARENREWVLAQLRDARATMKGWVVGWIVEPLEDVAKTLRSGGEGLGVEPATVNSDKQSLQRMVLDLGRDHYHLSGAALEALGRKAMDGNMEDVLKVYEEEMRNPLKNALLGDLVRTLLIQVQKTKVDLSLSLLSLDRLLRSQQLTFAFVGLAPSLLVLYGIGGWIRNVWRGEKRGKAKKTASVQSLRDTERILLLAGKKDQNMTDCDKGLLMLSVASMRDWANGMPTNKRNSLLDDLRLLEHPELSRDDKLAVVGRIWRLWRI